MRSRAREDSFGPRDCSHNGGQRRSTQREDKRTSRGGKRDLPCKCPDAEGQRRSTQREDERMPTAGVRLTALSESLREGARSAQGQE